MRHASSLIVIVLLAFAYAGPARAQDTEHKIWPSISPNQWFWCEPKTDLAPDQIEGIFREAIAKKMTFLDPELEGSVVFAKRIEVTTGKPKDRKRPVKVDGFKIDSEWQAVEDPKQKGTSSCFIPLDTVQAMDLWYLSNVAADNWRVRMVADATRTFVFGDEGLARRFMDAVASVLMQRALRLQFPKFGLQTENITPEQAEALGKTMIEGVLVRSVAIDGPADKAGIQTFDVIAEVNGTKVRNFSHFTSLEAGVASGAKVSVVVLQRAEVPDSDPKKYAWNPKTLEIIAR